MTATPEIMPATPEEKDCLLEFIESLQLEEDAAAEEAKAQKIHEELQPLIDQLQAGEAKQGLQAWLANRRAKAAEKRSKKEVKKQKKMIKSLTEQLEQQKKEKLRMTQKAKDLQKIIDKKKEQKAKYMREVYRKKPEVKAKMRTDNKAKWAATKAKKLAAKEQERIEQLIAEAEAQAEE